MTAEVTAEATRTPATVDARETAEQVRASVTSQVSGLLAEQPDDSAPLSDVFVGWVPALGVAECPARFHFDGETGWGFPGWSPPLAAAAAARAALAYHLRSTSGMPLPDPVGAVRAWMRAAKERESRTPVGDWVAEQFQARERAALAATAAAASRWLGGFVKVMGWPLPDDLQIVHGDAEDPAALRWSRYHRIAGPHGKVTVASSPDAVLGPVTPAGEYGLAVHRPSEPGEGPLFARAAFEAAAAAMTTGVVPGRLQLTAGDTGETVRVPVDPEVLEHGVELIVAVVAERVEGLAGDFAPAEAATPSTVCRYCDHLDRCPAGRDWMAAGGRWSGGLPTLTVP